MRLLRSLQFKVGIGITGTVALLFSFYVVWDYQFHRRQFLDELQDSAASLSKIILNGLVKVEMAGDHPDLLQASIEQFGRDPAIAGIYLLDTQGNVRFSSKPVMNDRHFFLSDTGCRQCHAAGGARPRSVFIEEAGAEVLRNAVAIPNQMECHPCHSAGNPLIGILIVDFGVERANQDLRACLNETLLKAAMTLVAILATLGLLMGRLIITRLKRLTAAAGMLAEERGDPIPKALEGSDEIGQLGAAFNRMVVSLEKHRGEVRTKERMRASLLEKIVRIQEEERKRISRELHDHVGQSLSALLLALDDSVAGTQNGNGHLRELESRIRGLLDEVHQLAWEMRPSILDDYGLDSALQTYVDDTAKHCGIPIDYQSSFRPEFERLPPWVEVTLYRVAQEALTNVVRHSQASRASVVLLHQPGGVLLLVEDNGCGFACPSPQNGHKGLGLIGMGERVNLCGGNCMIESAPERGTTVRVNIPLRGEIQ